MIGPLFLPNPRGRQRRRKEKGGERGQGRKKEQGKRERWKFCHLLRDF